MQELPTAYKPIPCTVRRFADGGDMSPPYIGC